MNPLIIQIAKGITMARFTRIRPTRVSSRPMSRNITKNGRMITTAGTNCVARIVTSISVSPRRLNRLNE